jgi:NitT/TauT family transport system substrate-binding protein
MRKRSLLAVALAAGLIAPISGCSHASAPVANPSRTGPMDPVRIGVGGIQKVIYGPAMLTEQLGYFKDEGLTVTLQDEVNGVNQENEMLAGHLDGVVGFMDHAVALQVKGKCVESVVQFANVPLEKVMVATGDAATIKTPADWKGKKVGFTSKGSSTDALMQALAAQAGVTQAQYTPAPVGAGSTFIAAIENGGINVGMTTPPTSTQLIKKGSARVLVDLSTVDGTKKALNGLYPASSLYMPCEWVTAHPRESQALANATVKTLRWIRAHTAVEIADKMPASYAGADKDVYVQSWQETKDGFTTDGVIDEDGVKNVLAVQSLVNEDVAKNKAAIKLTDCYTTQFVKNVSKT